MHHYTVRDHKILFGLYYDQTVDFSKATIEEARFSLAQVTVLASYYLCLPAVARRILKAFLSLQGLWQDVARFPWFYLTLAAVLRSPKLYTDAFRHVAASMDAYEEADAPQEAAENVMFDLEDLQDTLSRWHAHMIHDNRVSTARILKACGTPRTVTISEFSRSGNFKGKVVKEKIGFEALKLHRKKPRQPSKVEQVEFTARAVFQEWLVQALYRHPEALENPEL